MTGPISVVNSFGTTASAETVFIITDAPYLIELSPSFGPRGTDVILSGANFLNATSVPLTARSGFQCDGGDANSRDGSGSRDERSRDRCDAARHEYE